MESNTNTLTRYYATITVGDGFHQVGERHLVHQSDLDEIAKNGVRLRIGETDDVVTWHHYPCYVTKEVYRLDLISVETLAGNANGIITKEHIDYSTDNWQDRWP